jgi:hypothetical protein
VHSRVFHLAILLTSLTALTTTLQNEQSLSNKKTGRVGADYEDDADHPVTISKNDIVATLSRSSIASGTATMRRDG